MRKKWLFWWGANVFWLLSFAIISSFILLRKVDGAGVVQTPELKSLTLMILGFAFVIPVIIQIVWFIAILKNKKKLSTL